MGGDNHCWPARRWIRYTTCGPHWCSKETKEHDHTHTNKHTHRHLVNQQWLANVCFISAAWISGRHLNHSLLPQLVSLCSGSCGNSAVSLDNNPSNFPRHFRLIVFWFCAVKNAYMAPLFMTKQPGCSWQIKARTYLVIRFAQTWGGTSCRKNASL